MQYSSFVDRNFVHILTSTFSLFLTIIDCSPHVCDRIDLYGAVEFVWNCILRTTFFLLILYLEQYLWKQSLALLRLNVYGTPQLPYEYNLHYLMIFHANTSTLHEDTLTLRAAAFTLHADTSLIYNTLSLHGDNSTIHADTSTLHADILNYMLVFQKMTVFEYAVVLK